MRSHLIRILVTLAVFAILFALIGNSHASFSFFGIGSGSRGDQEYEHDVQARSQVPSDQQEPEIEQSFPPETTAEASPLDTEETMEYPPPPPLETEEILEPSPLEEAVEPTPPPSQPAPPPPTQETTAPVQGPPSLPNSAKILECPMRCPTVRNIRKRVRQASEEPQLLCCGDQCYDPKTQRCCRGQGHAVFPWDGTEDTPPEQLRPVPPQRQIGAATVCSIDSGCCLERCYKPDNEFCLPLVLDKNTTCNI